MLLGACAGPAARAPARSAGQLAGSPTISPSTINSRARRLPEPGSAQHHRHRHAGAAVCAPPAALPSESLPETRKDQEQRLAALEVQARQCELLLDQAEAAAAAAAAPKAAKAAADEALQPWVYAAAGAGSKAAKQLKGLRTEADEIVESLSKALCGDAPLEDSTLSQGWDRLLELQRRWAAAFPTLSATGLAAALMAALLSSLLVGRAAQAGQRAGRQAEQSADGKAQLRARTAAGGTEALLSLEVQLGLESELTCVEWAAATAARERAWAEGRRAALEAEVARWHAAVTEASQRNSLREAGEALACLQVCSAAAEGLKSGSMALTQARSSLADSRAALQLMAAEARMAGGVSELTHLRLTITAVLAAAVQHAPLVSSSGTVAPFLRMRVSDVAMAAAAGAVVLKEMRELVNSGQGGPDAGANLAAAEAKAAAAADMLGQLALCLAASAGVEWAAEE